MSDEPVKPAAGTPLAWQDCSLLERVRRIEQVLDEKVRPMLAADGGGIEVVDLIGTKLVVRYSGACGSCAASVGGTLYFVEDQLKENLGIEFEIAVQGAPRGDEEWA